MKKGQGALSQSKASLHDWYFYFPFILRQPYSLSISDGVYHLRWSRWLVKCRVSLLAGLFMQAWLG